MYCYQTHFFGGGGGLVRLGTRLVWFTRLHFIHDSYTVSQIHMVFYRIPCGTCLKVYVGQTCRTLDHQLKEHRRALTSGNLAQSAIAEHVAH